MDEAGKARSSGVSEAIGTSEAVGGGGGRGACKPQTPDGTFGSLPFGSREKRQRGSRTGSERKRERVGGRRETRDPRWWPEPWLH